MLDSDAQSMLTDLKWHWEDAYKILPGRSLAGRATGGSVRDYLARQFR